MTSAAFDIEALRPWIELEFSRSSGPGGQNVNKVNTRVALLFDFQNCPELSEAQRSRIRRQFPSRLSRDGRLRVVAFRERTQGRNRAAAEQRLLELLESIRKPPKPRRPTRPTAASRRRRLEDKRRRGETKQRRRDPGL